MFNVGGADRVIYTPVVGDQVRKRIGEIIKKTTIAQTDVGTFKVSARGHNAHLRQAIDCFAVVSRRQRVYPIFRIVFLVFTTVCGFFLSLKRTFPPKKISIEKYHRAVYIIFNSLSVCHWEYCTGQPSQEISCQNRERKKASCWARSLGRIPLRRQLQSDLYAKPCGVMTTTLAVYTSTVLLCIHTQDPRIF